MISMAFNVTSREGELRVHTALR